MLAQIVLFLLRDSALESGFMLSNRDPTLWNRAGTAYRATPMTLP